MKMKTGHTRLAAAVVFALLWGASFGLLSGTATAEPIPGLAAVPDGLPAELSARLARERQALEEELKAFLAAAERFNNTPAEQQTDAAYAELQARRALFVSKANSFNMEVKNAQAPAPVTDPNVVDLRDKKAPYIVEPIAPPPPPQAAAQRPATDLVSEFLFPGEPARRATTDDVKEFLFPGEPAGMDDVKEYLFPADAPRSLFPKNPDKPLINPLREPEKWKAFTEAAQKNIEAQARKKRADEVIKKMDEDPGLNKTRGRIVKEEEKAIYDAAGRLRVQATKQFEKLDKNYGVKDFNDYKEKEREDPAYRRKTKAIVDNYSEKVGEAAVKARQGSYRKMSVEVDKFIKNHPELPKEEGK